MLVSFVKSHIRPYMDEIVTLMRVSRSYCSLFICIWVKGFPEISLGYVDVAFTDHCRAVMLTAENRALQ